MTVSELTGLHTRHTAAFRHLIDDGFTGGNLSAVDDVIAVDSIEHQDGLGAGSAGTKRAIQFLHGAFPDFRLTIEDVTHDGDMLWARLRARGTHLGPLMGHAPTGRAFDITVIDVCRFHNGQIVEHWGVPDRFTQFEQLGLLPGPASGEHGAG